MPLVTLVGVSIIMELMIHTAAASGVLASPVWFNELMMEKNCTFTKMLYNEGQCDLRLFFSGEFPFYMQVIGLGLNEKLDPDTTNFGEAICRCGVMEVRGNCSSPMIKLLAKLRDQCGPDYFRGIPSIGHSQEEWQERRPPRVYQTVNVTRTQEDLEAELEIVNSSIDLIKSQRNANLAGAPIAPAPITDNDYDPSGFFF